MSVINGKSSHSVSTCLCDECIINNTINSVGDPHWGGTIIRHSHKSFEVLSILSQEKDFTDICISRQFPFHEFWDGKKQEWLNVRLYLGEIDWNYAFHAYDPSATCVFSGNYSVIMVVYLLLTVFVTNISWNIGFLGELQDKTTSVKSHMKPKTMIHCFKLHAC